MSESIFKKVVLLIAIFFIIWSHPVMLLVLLVFLLSLYSSFQQVKKDRFILLFIVVNVIMRIRLLSAYDFEKFNQFSSIGFNTGGFNTGYWLKGAKDYCVNYWYIVLAFVALTYSSVWGSGKQYPYKGLFMAPVLLFICGMLNFSVRDMLFPKYMYPVHLFIVVYAFVLISSVQPMHIKRVLILIVLALGWGIYQTISQNHQTLALRASLIHALNRMCTNEDPNQSKWYVRKDLLDSFAPFPYSPFPCSWYTESMLFSAFHNDTSTVQILWITESDLKEIKSTPPDKVLIVCGTQLPVAIFPPAFFHMKAGYYKELIIDSAKLDTLNAIN